ncbi:MAG: AraC family transcriptional regulator [Pseudomonadota bacterium]|nr:AraC family transcriptional regulator [Pseudomonadota bacterium]
MTSAAPIQARRDRKDPEPAEAAERRPQAARFGRASPRPSPGLSLIGPSRLLHVGPSRAFQTTLALGAAAFYASPDAPVEVSVDGDAWITADAIAVAPLVRHRFRTAGASTVGVMVEPETVDAAALRTLTDGADAAPRDAIFAARLLRGADTLATTAQDADWADAEVFDTAMFGAPLAKRALDPRIAGALRQLAAHLREAGRGTLSAHLAAGMDLSEDHFLRLFREQTGAAFSRHKRWKRARRFLALAGDDLSLTEVAMELGYPDSAWFSNSIRDVFGFAPRDIRQFAQGVPRMVSDR